MANWDREYNATRAAAQPSFVPTRDNDDDNDFDVYMAAAPPPPRQQRQRADGGGGGGGGGGVRDEESQLEQLVRHWINERHAPDILQAQDELLRGLLDRLKRQTDTVQLLRSDPASSEEEHVRIMLADTEVARVRFIINSYQRTRLYKIEKFARAIVADPDMQTRLTAIELKRAMDHARITDKHFHLSVLQSLPRTQQALDDTPVFMPSMVTLPDKTRPVFAHALVDCAPIRLPDGESLQMTKGHTSLVPYHVVEHLVARGEVELV